MGVIGFSKCYALVLLLGEGKTNQFGLLRNVGTIRHKDVRQCAVGAFAFYLSESLYLNPSDGLKFRFHVNMEDFPSFERSSNWYDYKMLRSARGGVTAEWSYDCHKKSFEKTFLTA